MPVLATTSPVGTARSLAGVNGLPSSATLFGGRRVNNDFRSGFRLTGGFWLNEDHTFGLEGDFFFLGQSRDGFAGNTAQYPVLARPFFNALTGQQDSQLVSYPGVVSGQLTANATSNVIGGGVNALHNLCCGCDYRVDLLYGYRYFNLTDEVQIQEVLAAVPGSALRSSPTLGYVINDGFRTTNNFHGGVIGLAGEKRYDKWYFGFRASVGLGANIQTTEIDGNTVTIGTGGATQVYRGGLLAQPSNIGSYTTTKFAVMPEIGLRAGMQLSSHCRVYAGYNFLYLSNVARAGDQIDTRVNPNFLPPQNNLGGPARPAYTGKTTDFWLQGVSVGLEVRF